MKKCKVYRDGGMHYIAIAPSEGHTGVRRKPPPEEPIVVVDQPPVSDKENQTDALPVKEDVLGSGIVDEFSPSECPDEKAVEEAENITATAGEKRISTSRRSFCGGIVNLWS